MKISTHKSTVVHARDRGFYVDEYGRSFSPYGREVGYVSKKVRFGHVYLLKFVSIKVGDKKRTFAIHLLQALQKFGDDIFKPGIHVRHLDGNSMNNSAGNIAIGTAHENNMDRTPIDRLIHSYKAAASKRIQEEKWTACDADRIAGMSFRDLQKKHGFHKSTLSYRYSKKAKRCAVPIEVAMSRIAKPKEIDTGSKSKEAGRNFFKMSDGIARLGSIG